MTKYYLIDDKGTITASSSIKFHKDCLSTEEDIFREGNTLYKHSDYNKLISSPNYIINRDRETLKNNLLREIAEIDLKRIRAIVEPSKKDENTTWLEYYTAQIQELRNKLGELS